MPHTSTTNVQKLAGLGWQWHDNGAIVQVRGTDQEGQPVSCGVFVPLDRIWAAFSKHLGAVGCPFPPGVGAPFSVGSLFSWVKKASKDVGHAVGKAGGDVVSVANKYGGHAIGKLGKEAMESKTFRGALDIASVAVPALAPAAGALETAHRIYDTVEKGKHAAAAIVQGFHTPENHQAVLDAHEHLDAVAEVIDLAHQGHPEAQEVIGALHIVQGLPIPPPSPLTPPLPPSHPHHRHHHHLHPGVPAPPVDMSAPPAPPAPSVLDAMPPGQPAPPTGYDAPPSPPTGYDAPPAPPTGYGAPPPPPGHPHHHRHPHHPGAAPGFGGAPFGQQQPYGAPYGQHQVPFHPVMHHQFTPAHATQLHRFLGQNYPHLKTVPIR